MSKLVSVPAQERFSETSLSNEVGESSGPLYTRYTCPRCRRVVNFTRNDFEGRGRRTTSNLPAVSAEAMSTEARQAGLDQHEYLDWLCPECDLPARVYFSQRAGGRGDRRTDLITVLEIG